MIIILIQFNIPSLPVKKTFKSTKAKSKSIIFDFVLYILIGGISVLTVS